MDIHTVVIRYVELNGYPLCAYSVSRWLLPASEMALLFVATKPDFEIQFKKNGLKGSPKIAGVIDGHPIIFIMRPQAS